MPVVAISFESLSGASPETDGAGAAALPRLRSVGSQQFNTGAAALPALRSTGTGSGTVTYFGTGSTGLSGLRSFGFAGADASFGSASLPPLRTLGGSSSLPVPQDGIGSASLSLLGSAGVISRGMVGVGDAALPQLRGFGLEPGGNYGSASLPPPYSAGAQAAPSYTAFINAALPELIGSAVGTNDLILTAASAHAAAANLQHIAPAIEQVMHRATATSSLRALEQLTERCDLAAVAALVQQVVTVEQVLLADAPLAVRRQIERAVDAVTLLGHAESKLVATQAVVAALTLEALALRGWRFDETAGTAFRAEAADTLRRIEALVASVELADVAQMSARFTFVGVEAVALADAATSKARFFELLRDGAAFHASLTLRGEKYVAWVLNAQTGGGVSRYEGFGFNSFACFEVGGVEHYFGAMDDGVHRLGGDSDNGAPIAAKVRSAMANFGSSRMKCMSMAYLGLTASGELILKLIITSPKGVKEAFWYTLEGRDAQALREDRVKPDGGLESVYWQWELVNTAGGDFDIDTMAFVPMALNRSV